MPSKTRRSTSSQMESSGIKVPPRTVLNVYHYGTQHNAFHRAQLTLELSPV